MGAWCARVRAGSPPGSWRARWSWRGRGCYDLWHFLDRGVEPRDWMAFGMAFLAAEGTACATRLRLGVRPRAKEMNNNSYIHAKTPINASPMMLTRAHSNSIIVIHKSIIQHLSPGPQSKYRYACGSAAPISFLPHSIISNLLRRSSSVFNSAILRCHSFSLPLTTSATRFAVASLISS